MTTKKAENWEMATLEKSLRYLAEKLTQSTSKYQNDILTR